MSWRRRAPELPGPAFETASIRPNTTNELRAFCSPGLTPNLWGDIVPSRGMVSITNAPLQDIIARAYAVNPVLDQYALVGGPKKVLSTRFDIVARPPDDAPAGQALPMLRRLLTERFLLRIRPKTRQRPIYALTVARSGRCRVLEVTRRAVEPGPARRHHRRTWSGR